MKEEELRSFRNEINRIDTEMKELFVKRMETAKKIGLYKKERGLPVFDAEREKEVIRANASSLEGTELYPYYADFLKGEMDLSKAYQESLFRSFRTAYSGVEGSFAYIASKRLYPEAEAVPYPNFSSAYRAVENGECDAAVLPFENSYAGEVGTVLDLLHEGSLFVNRVRDVRISQNLLAKKGTSLKEIRTVLSHPQALEQCRRYLEEHGIEPVERVNTAVAAKEVASLKDRSVGAIASKEAAELYRLEVLAQDINEAKDNTTRFAMFSKNRFVPSENEKSGIHFIVTFVAENEAGSLAKALDIVGRYGFNMRTIKSRPLKKKPWNYYFYTEIDGNPSSKKAREMLSELKENVLSFKEAGVYKEEL